MQKLEVQQNSSSEITELASLNPFTYRSYYYDAETKLYYLNSRYYDPVVGRFLNMDSVAYADAGTLNGLNLYAYCLNNPVMNIDPSGSFVISIGAVILTGIIAFFATLVIIEPTTHLIENATNNFVRAIDNFFYDVSIYIDSHRYSPAPAPDISIPNHTGNTELPSLDLSITSTSIIDLIGNIQIVFKEHTKGARPSTKQKHENGKAQRQRERFGGEKGDKRRKKRNGKRNRVSIEELMNK